MKLLRYSSVLFLVAIGLLQSATAQQTLPQLGKNSIQEVINAMTLEEKARLVVGKGFNIPGMGNNGTGVGMFAEKVAGAAGSTFAIPRLGIPAIVVADGPAGVRIDSARNDAPGKTFYATAWPVGTLLASSWDTALVKKVGEAFGNEVKEYGIDILLAPALNIHRNPLGGRNFEYYSEDPVVAGNMAAAMVNGIESNGVGTSVKHFAANNQETNRNSVNTIVSERALREIYLKNFKIAVQKSQPWTVMSSYNLINGTYASQSSDLLTTVLRKDWGFKGFVMTDWFGGKDAVAQMKAGNDLLMPGTAKQSEAIMEAVKSGALSEKVLDKNIASILNIILLSPSFKGYKYSDKPDLETHAMLAREAATEGMVLLKNDNNTLPLTADVKKIALFGNHAYRLIAGGTGSGDVNKAYTVSLAQGLLNAGYTVDAGLQSAYTAYLSDYAAKHPMKSFFEEFMNPSPPVPEMQTGNEVVSQKAADADLAIIVIGKNAGEGRDRKTEADYYLTDTEKAEIKKIAGAFRSQHKKVVMVLNMGGVIDVTQWKDEVDAILLAWQPGLEGGNAMADVLSGKVNPSGKLATTFPARYEDDVTAINFPGKEFPGKAESGALGMKLIPAEVTYEEGIYVGYRFYNSFGVKPAYEFGYGLSYTNFSYSNLTLGAATFSGTLAARVTITNTGKLAGKEVVQLYLSAPANTMDKPAEELKAFAKTKLLQPGEAETLSFVLSPSDLASFDSKASAWVAEKGTYTVKIGASSENIKQTATFSLPKELVVEKVNKALTPQVAISERKPTK